MKYTQHLGKALHEVNLAVESIEKSITFLKMTPLLEEGYSHVAKVEFNGVEARIAVPDEVLDNMYDELFAELCSVKQVQEALIDLIGGQI